ncbi:MAG: hypothetical protein HUK13_09495 [Muribaculaceae bacterium]|nr:hypothetical protein [Muribaculaceae bacterium]
MQDITDIFAAILAEYGSVDIANDAFKKRLPEDAELREAYSEWCHSVGSSEKNGFLDYCEEYLDTQSSKYDSLSDYNDDDN